MIIMENKKTLLNEMFSEFVNIIDENNIKIITYERGVGFTKACGTGSCSSVVVSKKLGLVKNEVFVHQALGKLLITIEDNNIYMEGPSKKVGEIIL